MNISIHTKRTLFHLTGICLLFLGLLGCQGFQPTSPGEYALKKEGFSGLWDAYTECRSETNTQAMERNLKILQAAPKPISLDDSPIPVPTFIKDLSSTRNSRLAVDPRAMAASCSIHLAKIAHQSADWNTSIRTWQTIIDQYPEPQYAFYVSEASRALAEISTIIPVTLPLRDSLVR